jgi:hypothetical protein
MLPPDPAAVLSPRTPLAGGVQLDVTIKVNESAVMQRSLLADNGGPATFEVGPLTIEAMPVLFDGYAIMETSRYLQSIGDALGMRWSSPSCRPSCLHATPRQLSRLAHRCMEAPHPHS